jgi:hypothetical protein
LDYSAEYRTATVGSTTTEIWQFFCGFGQFGHARKNSFMTVSLKVWAAQTASKSISLSFGFLDRAGIIFLVEPIVAVRYCRVQV